LCAQESGGGDTVQTRSAHLSEMCVTEGQRVEKGDTIGMTGSSGTDVPHFHYEVRFGGSLSNDLPFEMDPLGFMRSSGGMDPLAAIHVTSPASAARTLNGRTRPHRG